MASPPAGPHGPSSSALDRRPSGDERDDPYLVFRDGLGQQRIVILDRDRVAVGRTAAADVALSWDTEVSRVHAVIERIADGWALVDNGLSRNGSYLNHERVNGRRLLRDGDTMRFGETLVAFCDPVPVRLATTDPAAGRARAPRLTEAQRRVVVALCRPYAAGGSFAMPATNQRIADELVLSVDAVKSHLRVLFQTFHLDELPRHEKRVRLVERAFESGIVTAADFADSA